MKKKTPEQLELLKAHKETIELIKEKYVNKSLELSFLYKDSELNEGYFTQRALIDSEEESELKEENRLYKNLYNKTYHSLNREDNLAKLKVYNKIKNAKPEVIEKNKQFYLDNQERLKLVRNERYAENPEKEKELRKVYVENNKEKIEEYQKFYTSKDYIKNKEKYILKLEEIKKELIIIENIKLEKRLCKLNIKVSDSYDIIFNKWAKKGKDNDYIISKIEKSSTLNNLYTKINNIKSEIKLIQLNAGNDKIDKIKDKIKEIKDKISERKQFILDYEKSLIKSNEIIL